MNTQNEIYSFGWFSRCFKQAARDAALLAESYDHRELTARPAPGRWCAAECIAHLNEFGNLYYNRMQRAVETASPDEISESARFRPRIFWRGVVRIFEPPYKLKMKTIRSFRPGGQQIDAEAIIANFETLQDRFVEQLKRCRQKGVDLNRVKAGNPALPFVKMRLSECYAVLDAHQRRHLWQARQTLSHLHDENEKG